MPYTTAEMTEEEMNARADDSVCAECYSRFVVCWGGYFGINSMILRCSRDPQHQGIARVAEIKEYSTKTRRKFMEKDHGKETAIALRRYESVAVLNRKSASEILEIFWPNAKDASPAEFERAVGLCIDYGLDPRLDDLFLIPFKDADTGIKEYKCVRGIKATRKIALRKHKYSYIDFTPRRMTEEEEVKVFGVVDHDQIRFITKLKDVETGAEAPGYGVLPKYKKNGKDLNLPHGSEKGNTPENMCAIHSERNALDRLYPADMPSRIPVVDEAYIDADYTISDLKENRLEEEKRGGETDSIRPADGEKGVEHVRGEGERGKEVGGGEEHTAQNTFSPLEGDTPLKKSPSMPPADSITGEGFTIPYSWLNESQKALNWPDDTMLSFLASEPYKVTGKTVAEALGKLSREKAERFTRAINEKVEKIQPGLFN